MPSIPERVLHHAIMNVCQPHFALLVLDARFARGKATQRTLTYQTSMADTRSINNWDLVDSSATRSSVPTWSRLTGARSPTLRSRKVFGSGALPASPPTT